MGARVAGVLVIGFGQHEVVDGASGEFGGSMLEDDPIRIGKVLD